ncbi:helix-turn-helix domain-containing protein, partial [Acetivibrio sp. MSJd-27]|uniref:helix-turn-helix domain-containing protein n=1 Tax=Acetivibrio sp. MSJd-27 TaxID=2841523 RepID=UPI001C120A74|nr:helix-turn-helix domain containing protein [Acetivibrio sp. MSJd-27]
MISFFTPPTRRYLYVNFTKKYDENFKKSIVTLHQNGKTQTQLAKEYGISLTAISRWVKQYSEIKID